MATSRLENAPAPSNITKWVDTWETSSYPTGRNERGRAVWTVTTIRGGRKTVARQTASRTGALRDPKTLTSGTHAKIGVDENAGRCYSFIYDADSKNLHIYDGTMDKVGFHWMDPGEKDPYGFVEQFVADVAPIPKKEPAKKERDEGDDGDERQSGEEFLGVAYRDGNPPREKVRGHVFGQWGVYLQVSGFYRNHLLIHIPTGLKVVETSGTRKKLLWFARRLQQFAPITKTSVEDLTLEEKTLIGEIVRRWMPDGNIRNNGLLKDGVAEPDPPTTRITNRTVDDARRVQALTSWKVALRFLTQPNKEQKAVLDEIDSGIAMLSTGLTPSGDVVSPAFMEELRKFVDDPNSSKRVRNLLEQRKPDGENLGDFVHVTMGNGSRRGIVLRTEGDLVACAVEEYNKTVVIVVPKKDVSFVYVRVEDFTVKMLETAKVPTGPLSLTVDEYKKIILEHLVASGKQESTLDIPGILGGVQPLIVAAVFALEAEGLVERVAAVGTRTGTWDFRATAKSKESVIPQQILEWLKRTIPMLPVMAKGMLPHSSVARKFPIEEERLLQYMRQLEQSGAIHSKKIVEYGAGGEIRLDRNLNMTGPLVLAYGLGKAATGAEDAGKTPVLQPQEKKPSVLDPHTGSLFELVGHTAVKEMIPMVGAYFPIK